MTAEKKPIERYRQFEVTIEPVFIPGEGRLDIDKFRTIIVTVYALDILDAIERAKNLIDVKEEEAEIISVVGLHGWRPATNR